MALLKRFGEVPGAPGQGGFSTTPTRGRDEPQFPRSNGISPREQAFFDLQRRVQTLLVTELEQHKIDLSKLETDQAHRIVAEHLQRIIDAEAQKQGLPLSRTERASLFERCSAEIVGLGPIEPLLRDESITEIMVNGPAEVYVEQTGKIAKTSIRFQDEQHVMRIIERIVSQAGRRVDETSPMVDARLRDGSRVNAIIPPIALDGPKLTIRKHSKHALQPEDLVKKGSITREMLAFLEACVKARFNIIVSGGTGSGKTSLLNVLSIFIPANQRIITIEDAAELQLQQDHVVRLESRPASVEGKNRIAIRDLLVNTLRMRPDRIIVGECRGGEALDMLQAMNTGHDGSMTTIHANSAHDVLTRLETLVLQAGVDLPQRAIREQIANAVHLIVHTSHMEDGTRKVETIAELRRGSGESIDIADIFEFERTGTGQNGQVLGRLRPTGVRPRALDTLERIGVQLPPTLFQR